MNKQGKVKPDSARVMIRKIKLQEIAKNIECGNETIESASQIHGFSVSAIKKAISTFRNRKSRTIDQYEEYLTDKFKDMDAKEQQTKQDNVPQVKSVEEIFNLMVDECPFEMHEMTTKPYIIEAMELYAKQFQSRIEELEKQKDDLELMFETRKELDMEILKFQRDKIAELEASNDKYREALDSILSEVNHSEQDKDAALNNIYELAGKALNSKEVGNG